MSHGDPSRDTDRESASDPEAGSRSEPRSEPRPDGGGTEEYGGLVRDRVPELIRERGRTPETHVADDAEFDHLLGEKLVEEAEEYADDGDAEDLADVLAVVGVICGARGIDREELERVGRERVEELGGFEDRTVLDRVRE